MSHWQMYQKPKYRQDDTVWVDRGAEQPVKGQVLFYIGRRKYEVALSSQGVKVVQEQALSIRTKGERR
jgi:phage repressor protein C with HTH and peptisase S24 domain